MNELLNKKNIKITWIIGTFLMLFLVHHSLGAMLIWPGRDSFNSFSQSLRSHPVIYLARFILVLVFIVHPYCSFKNHKKNRRFKVKLFSGLMVLLFTLFHITAINVAPEKKIGTNRDLSSIMELHFENIWTVSLTLIGIAAIVIHLIEKFNPSVILEFDTPSKKYLYFIKSLSILSLYRFLVRHEK